MANRLELMVSAGLLEESVSRKGRVAMVYSLSPLGEFTAKMLRLCDKAMEGEFDFEKNSVDEYLVKDE